MTTSGESLSVEQRIALLESRVNNIEASLAGADGAKPERLRFAWPVGTDEQRSKPWPVGDWFIAQGYAKPYPPSMGRKDYHTGIDLNRPNYLDSGSPVHAVADGAVVFSGYIKEWGNVIVTYHLLEDGRGVWARYAHLANSSSMPNRFSDVHIGQWLADVGDYAPLKVKAGDHLHFDLAKIDLGANPSDWPGAELARLKRDYLDPVEFISGRL